MPKSLLVIYLCVVAPQLIAAESGPERSAQVSLASGEIVIASEGTVEPRSIGSIAIRVYLAANPQFPYDRFLTGLIRPRDGALEGLQLSDLDDDGSEEIVVVIRSAGSGGYLSAEAFRLHAGELTLIAAVADLPSDGDVIEGLQRALR